MAARAAGARCARRRARARRHRGGLPQVDGGRFAAKRVAGERVEVEADCFTDGHDALRVHAALAARPGEAQWSRGRDGGPGQRPLERALRRRPHRPLRIHGRRAGSTTSHPGATDSCAPRRPRRHRASPRSSAPSSIDEPRARRAADRCARGCIDWARRLREERDAARRCARWAWTTRWWTLARAPSPTAPGGLVRAPRSPLVVDRERARFSSWYELFPRSVSAEPGRHGTFADVERACRRIAAMGFDVLYLPPIHPIGRMQAQGPEQRASRRSRTTSAARGRSARDEGGHKAIHPDARHARRTSAALVQAAREHGIEIALDIAFQCVARPPLRDASTRSGSAAAPTAACSTPRTRRRSTRTSTRSTSRREDWRALWQELKERLRVLDRQGVKIFRVDNPHTKAFAVLGVGDRRVQARQPGRDLPRRRRSPARKVMHRLAKLGFTQSYTYFTWRNSKHELTEYFTELARGPGREYFRPNCWPNTPDILPEHLQFGAATGCSWRARAGRHARGQLRHLRPGLRAAGAPAARAGQRGVPRQREVRAAPLGPRDRRRQPRAAHRARERDPPRATRRCSPTGASPSSTSTTTSSSPTRSARATNAVLVVVNLDPYHAQSRLARARPGRARPRRRRRLPGARPALGRHATCGRARATSCSLDPRRSPAHVFARAPRTRTSATSTTSIDSRGDSPPRRPSPPLGRTTRCGTRTRSSTSCTSRRSSTPTATASAISGG